MTAHLFSPGNMPVPLYPTIKRIHPGVIRRRKIRKAKAAWSTWADMRMLTPWAKAMSIFHGVPYVVDHQVPLASKYVCGLHCSVNLKVITKLENDRKQNTWWPDMWGAQEKLI